MSEKIDKKFVNEESKEEEEEDEEEDEDYNPANDADRSDDSGDDTFEEEKKDNTKLREINEDKLDAVWMEFLHGGKTEEKKAEKVVVSKQYDFAGETVTVTEEVDAEKVKDNKASTSTKEVIEPALSTKPTSSSTLAALSKPKIGSQMKRPAGGLSALVNSLKKPKMSVLTKSNLDWNEFKKKEGLEEDLSLHRKSKESFIERQAFLLRTDLREFEREKAVREQERKARNSKPNL